MKYKLAIIGGISLVTLLALNYKAQEGTNLFSNEELTEEDYLFMNFIAKYGKTYGTKSEYEFRSSQFKKTLA